MAIGRLPRPLEAANDQPWAEDIRFWADRAKTQPVALTFGEGWLSLQGGASVTHLTGDMIVLSGNVLGLRLSKPEAQALAAGTYDLEVQATDANGGVHQLRGVLKVEAGLG